MLEMCNVAEEVCIVLRGEVVVCCGAVRCVLWGGAWCSMLIKEVWCSMVMKFSIVW